MSTTLYFKIKDSVSIDKHSLITLLFKDCIDESCDNQVQYGQVKETFCVDFEKQEDAVAMSLRGVPKEFRLYLEIIK